jgi:hypothetical protein
VEKPAFLVVRAVVADEAERAAFDHWYETDHVVAAKRAFRAERAWRFWSRSDPSVHYAAYRFAGHAALEEALKTSEAADLIADFDRSWPEVTRTRDILEGVQVLD